MTILAHHADHEAYKREQRTHQLEHASNVTPTLDCDAVGHFYVAGTHLDSYNDFFDADQRRKFCIATNRPW